MNQGTDNQLMKGVGPHNSRYLRGLSVLGGGLAVVGVVMISLYDYDHRVNEMLNYQRWLFKRVDNFLGVSEKDLKDAGYVQKYPAPKKYGIKKV